MSVVKYWHLEISFHKVYIIRFLTQEKNYSLKKKY